MIDMKAPSIPSQPDAVSQTPVVEGGATTPNNPVEPTDTTGQSAQTAPVSQPDSNTNKSVQEQMQKIQEKTNQLHQQFNALPDSKKKLIVYALIFLAGLIFGGIFLGGSDSSEAPVVKGLQGVVSNTDIREPLKRCGMVSMNDACVLYVMNNFSYEKQAKDFFDTVSNLMQRPLSLVTSENIHYQTQRIKPGYFAEIKIPARR